MSMHVLTLPNDGTVLNVFADAVPAIPAGSTVYLQNITSNEALFADNTDIETAAMVITALGSATSVMSLDSGEVGFVRAKSSKVTLICQVV